MALYHAPRTIHTPTMVATMLSAAGYECLFCPEEWQDVGGPESGPRVEGHAACDYWSLGGDYYVFKEGVLVDSGFDPYWDFDPDGVFAGQPEPASEALATVAFNSMF